MPLLELDAFVYQTCTPCCWVQPLLLFTLVRYLGHEGLEESIYQKHPVRNQSVGWVHTS